jgi:hypothetical protein
MDTTELFLPALLRRPLLVSQRQPQAVAALKRMVRFIK